MKILESLGDEIVGGGTKECLKEVVIALEALEMDYNINHDWTY